MAVTRFTSSAAPQEAPPQALTHALPQAPPSFASPPPVEEDRLTAPKILLMGVPGTGKSTALATYLKHGVELFMFATEPNAVDAVIDRCRLQNIDMSKFHWKYVRPNPGNWNSLSTMVKTINSSSAQTIAEMKNGIDKTSANQVGRLIQNFQNFHCDHCGKDFGDITEFGFDKCVALDSLSGLNVLSRQCTVGFKPTMHIGEWGICMGLEEAVISMLTNGLTCHFVLIAHVDREKDELTGGLFTAPSALGAKLGPKLGKDFREVIMAKINDGIHIWSNKEANSVTKRSALPLSDSLSPDFTPIIRAFEQRVKATQTEIKSPPLTEPAQQAPGTVQ